MSREHQQPTEPPHPRCGAHWGRAARAAAATQPPPGTHSLARRPGGGRRGRRRERERGKGERRPAAGEGGSPALRSRRVRPKSSYCSPSICRALLPRRLLRAGQRGAGEQRERQASVRGGTASFPATGGCGSGGGLGASRAESRLRRRARTNNLKWQRRHCVTRPSAAPPQLAAPARAPPPRTGGGGEGPRPCGPRGYPRGRRDEPQDGAPAGLPKGESLK